MPRSLVEHLKLMQVFDMLNSSIVDTALVSKGFNKTAALKQNRLHVMWTLI